MDNFKDQELVGKKKSATTRIEKDLEHISVCFCTYQRLEMLGNLLEGLMDQETYNKFTYSIIVVDNDPNQSAKEIVYSFKSKSDLQIDYYHEPRKGLTYARNKSINNSRGDYIAILDDDEVPAWDWLYQLFKTLKEHQADAVFGSVIPNFEVEPPAWIKRRKYFYWRDMRAETGTETNKCVTNNALVRRDLVLKYDLEFDHDFAFLGGEDQAFFFEFLDHKPDAKFLNCNQAVVYEYIPSDRCDPTYLLKRNLLEGRGRVFGIYKFSETTLQKYYGWTRHFLQSYFKILLISSLLPFLLFFKKDLGAEYYYRNFYHFGIVLALFNFSPFQDRQSIGLQ